MLQPMSSQEAVGLPPGFDCSCKLNRSKKEASCIPRVEWRCPPKFVISHGWHVAAGEESREKDSQMQRQMGAFEAVYPRLSAISQNPSVTLEVKVERFNDILTPIIPLTPIEEEEAADAPCELVKPLNAPLQLSKLSEASGKSDTANCHNHVSKSSICQKTNRQPLINAGVDLVTVASAALSAIMKSNEQGSLIDTDLLVKIFNDPKMIEKLMNDSHIPDSAEAPDIVLPKPNLIPPFCCNPPASSSLIGANHKSHDMQSLMQSTSMPGKTLISHSSRSPTLLVTPMPPNGPLHLPIDSKPAISRVSQRSDPIPVSGLKPVAPSFSMPPGPVAGDLYPKPILVRPTLSTMPTQVNVSPRSSSLSSIPNGVPDLVLPTLSVIPTGSYSVPQPPVATMKINPVKDMNYIKNLIKEHGRDKRDKPNQTMSLNGTLLNHVQNMEFAQNVNLVKVKRKSIEPCVYFKTSRGCRRGSKCPYQHDLTLQWQTGSTMDASSAKRMKLGGEIVGR